ncbi:unnamed protein product, partial [Allacma fusca]
ISRFLHNLEDSKVGQRTSPGVIRLYRIRGSAKTRDTG